MPGDPQRPVTGRVRLARLAAEAVDATPGVRPTAGRGGRWQTPDGAHTIPGVVAAEIADGRVELGVHLEALWPPEPLEALAGALRQSVERSASGAGMADRLGPVEIAFHDIVDPSAGEGGS